MNRSVEAIMSRRGMFAAATAATVVSLIWVATARGQDPSVPRTPMAEEVFTNVQVLKPIFNTFKSEVLRLQRLTGTEIL